jgi:hypothetical protein
LENGKCDDNKILIYSVANLMNLPKYVLTCAEHKNKLDPSMSLFADPLLSRSFIYKMLKMSGMKVPFVVM